MIERCAVCDQSLGTYVQDDLFGAPKKCIECLTKDRVGMMLKVLPQEGKRDFLKLSDFEQSFLTSLRKQFAKKGTLSEKQYVVLERIYEKVE